MAYVAVDVADDIPFDFLRATQHGGFLWLRCDDSALMGLVRLSVSTHTGASEWAPMAASGPNPAQPKGSSAK